MHYFFQDKRVKIIIFRAIMVSMLMGNHVARADILDASVEFSVPYNSAIGPSEPFTPLVHFNDNTYLVWVDANFRPWVTQKINNKLTTAPLDVKPDYTAFPDGHHRYSMGIDKNGYLHIAGDMHYYPSLPANYLPVRYQNQTVMYWVSNQPYDVTNGFTFAGGAGASTAIPGQYFNTGHFFNDNYGELYFTAMIRAYQSASFRETGEQGVGLYKYNATNKTWSIIGGYGNGVYPAADNVQKWKAFFWEYAGLANGPGQPGWFQNFWPSFTFDKHNRLHFAVSAVVDGNEIASTRMLYASSPDSGATWYKANGIKIPGLPLRGNDSAANLADIVFDTKGTATFAAQNIGVAVGLIVDAHGQPLVNYQITDSYNFPWVRWNGTNWTNDVSNSHQALGTNALIGSDNKITFVDQVNGIWLRRTTDFNQFSSVYHLQAYLPTLGLHNFQCISDIGIKTTGSLYGIGIGSSNMMNVIKLTFEPKPLPSGWAFQDVAATVLMGGAADYENGTFTVRAWGGGVSDTSDSLGFTYYTLIGDGTFIARLTYRDTIASNFVDGIMMRESLNANAQCVMVGASNSGLGHLRYRTGTGAQAGFNLVYNVDAPQWFRLVRLGDVFTASYSADGVAWTQFGAITIVMAHSIYVGLVSNGSEVHTCTFDNVEIF